MNGSLEGLEAEDKQVRAQEQRQVQPGVGIIGDALHFVPHGILQSEKDHGDQPGDRPGLG